MQPFEVLLKTTNLLLQSLQLVVIGTGVFVLCCEFVDPPLSVCQVALVAVDFEVDLLDLCLQLRDFFLLLLQVVVQLSLLGLECVELLFQLISVNFELLYLLFRGRRSKLRRHCPFSYARTTTTHCS